MAIKRSKKRAAKNEVTHVTLRHVRVSPQKARLVLDLIRGRQVEPALQVLRYSTKKTARLTLKLLQSAVANVSHAGTADVDKLWVTQAWVDGGRPWKRFMPRAQGRGVRIIKRTSHINLVLGER